MKSKSGVGTKIKFISHIEKIVGKSVKQLEWYIYAINHPAKVQGSIFYHIPVLTMFHVIHCPTVKCRQIRKAVSVSSIYTIFKFLTNKSCYLLCFINAFLAVL